MKYSLGFRLSVLVITFTLLGASPAQCKVFKIATLTPEGSGWMKSMRAASKQIERQTDKRVKFKFYPGGVMGSEKAVLRKMRIGQLHGGAFPGGALTKFYPDSLVYNLPLKFHSFEEIDYVRSHMDKLIVEGLDKGGLVTFGLAEGGLAYLMTHNPVTTVEDLRKQKVWIPSGDPASLVVLDAYGVSPIPLGLSDVLASLQTGLINTVTTSPIAAIALQWHTQVQYITDIPLLYFYMVLAIDKKAINKISPADQKIVRQVMGKTFTQIDQQNRKDNIQAFKALQQQGIELVTPTPQQSKDWIQAAQKATDKMVNDGQVSTNMLKALEGHLKDYRQQQTTAHAQ